MYCRANSGNGGEDGPEFMRCVDGRQPQIHEVWTFGEDGVTREVHTTARVDAGAVFVGGFATDYLTPNWRRFPMFGINSINRSLEWIGVPDFLRNDGPPCNLNLLAPYANWRYIGSSTNPNWGSVSGGDYYGVSFPWNRPACVLPLYHRRIFEITCSSAHCARNNLLMENPTYLMQSPSNCHNPICGHLVNQQDDGWDYRWDFLVGQ